MKLKNLLITSKLSHHLLLPIVPFSGKRVMGLQTGSGIVLTLLILILLNIVFHFIYLRIDISKGHLYSMSKASKKIISHLPDPVLIKVYYSKELPSQIAMHKNYLKDLLKEYLNYSKGKLKISYVEIGENEEEKRDAIKNGIAPVRFDIISKEKYEQREGFLGLTIRFRDQKEVIPFLQDITNLEYDLTSRIKFISRKDKPVVAFITDYNAQNKQNLNEFFLEKANFRYELKEISFESILSDTATFKEINTFLFMGPEGKISQKDLFVLDQILMAGKSVCLAIDTKKTDLNSFFATNNDTGLPDFLAKNGLKILNTIVMDEQSQPIQISARQGPFIVTNVVRYPPFVISTDLDKKNPVTKDMSSIILPFSSPIEISTSPASIKSEVLAKSSKYSFAKSPKGSPYMSINPFGPMHISDTDIRGPFNLAVFAYGKFAPYFDAPPENVKVQNFLKEAVDESRLILISSSKFMKNQYRMPLSNYDFLLNIIDYLSQDIDLISIRSKSASFKPLKEISVPLKTLTRYLNIFLPSFVVLFLGIWKWHKRKAQKNIFKSQYNRKESVELRV